VPLSTRSTEPKVRGSTPLGRAEKDLQVEALFLWSRGGAFRLSPRFSPGEHQVRKSAEHRDRGPHRLQRGRTLRAPMSIGRRVRRPEDGGALAPIARASRAHRADPIHLAVASLATRGAESNAGETSLGRRGEKKHLDAESEPACCEARCVQEQFGALGDDGFVWPPSISLGNVEGAVRGQVSELVGRRKQHARSASAIAVVTRTRTPGI